MIESKTSLKTDLVKMRKMYFNLLWSHVRECS